jgi:hypothetical protein
MEEILPMINVTFQPEKEPKPIPKQEPVVLQEPEPVKPETDEH